MAKISITSQRDQASGKFASVVTPGPGSRVEPFTSESMFATHDDAVLWGVRYLESQGVSNINWHAVVELLV